MVLMIHGMGGCHLSGYLVRISHLLYSSGIRPIRMDMRGCGAGMAIAKRTYHAGCSEDILAAMWAAQRLDPLAPIILIGFSLSGNAVLRLAAEPRKRLPDNLVQIISVAPPISLQACSARISHWRNRIYERYFVRLLIRQARERAVFFPARPAPDPRRTRSLRDFDDAYTAPQWGFDGALDYYQKCSSQRLIPQIDTPTLIITANNDPFIDAGLFDGLRSPKCVQIRIVPGGGHLGFLGRAPNGSIRWLEHELAKYCVEKLRNEGSTGRKSIGSIGQSWNPGT